MRDWTHTPCAGRQSLIHWTSREAPTFPPCWGVSWIFSALIVFDTCPRHLPWDGCRRASLRNVPEGDQSLLCEAFFFGIVFTGDRKIPDSSGNICYPIVSWLSTYELKKWSHSIQRVMAYIGVSKRMHKIVFPKYSVWGASFHQARPIILLSFLLFLIFMFVYLFGCAGY